MMRRQPLVLVLLGLSLPVPVSSQIQITARAAEIRVGGQFQVQHSVSSVDGSDGTTDAVDDVFLRRARITLEARIADLDARVEPDFAGGGSGVGVADWWVRWTPASGFRLSAGQFKRAFSIFELQSGSDLPDIERDARIEGLVSCPGVGNACSFSRFTQSLQLDARDMGVRAEGTVGSRLSYLITLTNGQGRNLADVNDAKSVSGRVSLEIISGVEVAGYAASHDYLGPAPARDTEYAQAFGADLEVGTFRNRFHLMLGASGGDNWLSSPSSDFNAVQAIASYYFALREGRRLAGIEPMLRLDRSSTEDAAGLGISALILTPGISLYLNGKNWLGINFDHYDPSRGDRAWSLKTQFFFYY
jgi:hypothetical protein